MVTASPFRAFDVVRQDGVFCARMPSGELRPIRHDGEPVRDFIFGWSPGALVDPGTDVLLLELRFHDGHRATWFLDAGLNRICGFAGHLPPDALARLLDAFLPFLHAVYHGLLASPTPQAPPGAEVAALVCEPTMRNLAGMTMPRIAPGLCARRPGSPLSDAEGFDRRALDPDLQQALDRGLAGDPMPWRSPLDGTEQQSRDSVVVSEQRFGYRFRDAGSGTIFYVGAGAQTFRCCDIFVPALQRVLLDVPDDTAPGAGGCATVAEEYLAHAATHAVALCRYLSDGGDQPAAIVRGFPGMHIGHHVWNDLSALDRLQRGIPADRLSLVFVQDADNGSEPFAPIDQILPGFAGRIDRSHAFRKETPGSLAYRRDLFLVRPIDELVSTHLSRRIREASLAQPTARDAVASAREYRDRGHTIITLGMRVENRTATDIGAVTEQIIGHLASRIDRLVVVLDGQNARIGNDPTTCFGSHGQPAHLHALLPELELVPRLRRRYHYTGVSIVSTIGASTPCSIAWCAAFIAFWGAGFTKYRWVCNKPGLALSGHWNLTRRHDLHIYDHPQWQEDPSRLIFIDPACVTDRPELGIYFSIVSPVPITYATFEIDPDGLRRHIDLLLDSLPAAA